MEKKLLPFFVLILLIQLLVPTVNSSIEIDKTTVVSWVIDGDTFDTTSGDRIRLADVDAPERGERGYNDARDFLGSLVFNRQVYLDVDDVYRTDRYGRLVCVVYVEHNSTHYRNVNKALLVYGYGEVWDFDNEFDPYTWSLFHPKVPPLQQPFDLPSRISFLSPFPLAVLVFVILVTLVTLGILIAIKMKDSPKLMREHKMIGLALFSLCSLYFGGLFAITLIECTTRCLFAPYPSEYQVLLTKD